MIKVKFDLWSTTFSCAVLWCFYIIIIIIIIIPNSDLLQSIKQGLNSRESI